MMLLWLGVVLYQNGCVSLFLIFEANIPSLGLDLYTWIFGINHGEFHVPLACAISLALVFDISHWLCCYWIYKHTCSQTSHDKPLYTLCKWQTFLIDECFKVILFTWISHRQHAWIASCIITKYWYSYRLIYSFFINAWPHKHTYQSIPSLQLQHVFVSHSHIAWFLAIKAPPQLAYIKLLLAFLLSKGYKKTLKQSCIKYGIPQGFEQFFK